MIKYFIIILMGLSIYSLQSQMVEHWDIIFAADDTNNITGNSFGINYLLTYDKEHFGFLDGGHLDWGIPNNFTMKLILTRNGGKNYFISFNCEPTLVDNKPHNIAISSWRYITQDLLYICADSFYQFKYDGVNEVRRYKGNVFKSTDGGLSWEHIEINNNWRTRFTSAFSMADSVNGILVQLPSEDQPDEKTDQIYITNNGWKSWFKINTHPEQKATYVASYFYPNKIITISRGHNKIFVSNDLGNSWEKIQIPDSIAKLGSIPYYAIYNDSIILITTDTKIYKSVNSAITWNVLFENKAQTVLGRTIIINDSCLIAQRGDDLLITKDNGKNWELKYHRRFYYNNLGRYIFISKWFEDNYIIASAGPYVLKYTGKKNLKPPKILKPTWIYKVPLDFTIEWERIIGAEKYELQIVEREGHNLDEPDKSPPINFDTTLFDHKIFYGDTSYTLSGTKPFKEYLFRLRSMNQTHTSEWLSDFRVTEHGTSVYEFINVNNLFVTPNPASDYIEVAVPAEQIAGDVQQVRIYNMLGQCVLNHELRSTNNEAKAKIDIRHLPAGLYYIRIGGNGLPFIKN